MSQLVRKTPSDIRRLLTVSARLFATHGSGIGDTLSAGLKQAAATYIPVPDSPVAPAPDLAGLLCQAPADIAQPLGACSTAFKWRKPGFGTLPATISDKIEVTEIVGPDGMLQNRQIRVGLLLQHRDHIYPEHHHAAEELYFILAGQANWVVDNGEPKSRGAGKFVHHKPRQFHSMKTECEPMLALWGWTGQIESSTYGLKDTD